jgi:hypothetical protein
MKNNCSKEELWKKERKILVLNRNCCSKEELWEKKKNCYFKEEFWKKTIVLKR